MGWFIYGTLAFVVLLIAWYIVKVYRAFQKWGQS